MTEIVGQLCACAWRAQQTSGKICTQGTAAPQPGGNVRKLVGSGLDPMVPVPHSLSYSLTAAHGHDDFF